VVAVSRSRLRAFSIAKFRELLEMQDRTVYRMVLALARLIAKRLQSSDQRRVS
jgi:CRP-like cAMP-binding protein